MASGERGEARASLTRISESLTRGREPLAWGKKPPKLPQSCGEDNGEEHIMDEIPVQFFCLFSELQTSKQAKFLGAFELRWCVSAIIDSLFNM